MRKALKKLAGTKDTDLMKDKNENLKERFDKYQVIQQEIANLFKQIEKIQRKKKLPQSIYFT